MILGASATYTGGSSSSFISGKLTRVYNNSSTIQVLTYPTGEGDDYLPVDLGIRLNAATNTPFSVEQFDDSGIPSYSLGSGLFAVSAKRYWEVVKGSGATVSNAQITIRWTDDDWVLVHDAARPCIRPGDIESLLSTIENHDAGGLLGLPIADTVKRADSNNAVTGTVDRSGLWRALTPQVFRYGVIKHALQTAIEKNITL